MTRPAAELRAAAIASGWFDGPDLMYVGDGYSIPWQTGVWIGPPFGGLLYLWKSYLDTNYLEPSRLHDWLYTPYGVDLIQATRDESDLALQEEMLAAGTTTAEANVVYQACRLGGAPYFGVSSIGYVQPVGRPSGPNMPLAPSSRENQVADYKVVMVFQQTSTAGSAQPSIGYASTARTGGWTESFYIANRTIAEISLMMKGPRTDTGAGPILAKRAGCLNSSAAILGYRLYENGGGRGQFISAAYPGQVGGADVPSMSLLCQSYNPATPSVRRFSMRGIPDGQVENGEFNPSTGYTDSLRAYFQSLSGTSYKGRNTVAATSIFTITNAGLVTARGNLAYTVGTIVTIKTTMDTAGRKRSGEYVVASVGPLTTQLTLTGWQWGATERGTISLPTAAFFVLGLDSTTAVRIGNHKIGRPFAGYRGRNSRRTA